jgi:Tfp pilus assembly protein PilN
VRAVNLIPAEQRESGVSLVGRSNGAALAIVVLLVGLAVLAFMYGSAKHSESKSKAELTTVDAELANARAQVGRLAPYTSFIAMANQRIQAVSALVAARFDWSHAFHELGRVLPRDVLLSSLQGSVGAGTGPTSSSSPGGATTSATPTSATPPGSTPTFALSGCASTQSEVAETLQRLRLIDGVVDVELQSSVKSSSGGSASAPSASGAAGGCAAGGATFAAQVTFAGLPSALPSPPTAPAGAGASAGAAQPNHTEQVSSQGAGR